MLGAIHFSWPLRSLTVIDNRSLLIIIGHNRKPLHGFTISNIDLHSL